MVFGDVFERRWFWRSGDRGSEASDTGVVVGGKTGDKGVKDGGLVGNGNE